MHIYHHNKQRAKYANTKPTMTDQSQAKETDINIIIGRFLHTGTVPAPTGKEPFYGDFSELPRDLQGFINQGRSLERLRAQLPEKLQNMPTEELLALTPKQLRDIIEPPATPPATDEEKK